MARFELRVRPSVAKDLKSIPKQSVLRILDKIKGLRDDPRPIGCEKLSGLERYRVRQGCFRIIYSIFDDEIVVEIVKVGRRKNVYR